VEPLAASLARARQLLGPIESRLASARRALDQLERDLLPRNAGGDVYLVAGIVGPNNAGKSALFNALVGRDLSPSVPTGGATRRLIGAAHSDLAARLIDEPSLARFRIRPLAERDRLRILEQPPADPTELALSSEDSLPTGLLLIDTPDFDSILEDNRIASESLLAVADLVITVVTRHSYQNREVVQFLQGWLEHERPWLLVYNEAIDATVARAHAAKLTSDVGGAPLAAFWAPHSLDVQRGAARLEPERLATENEERSWRLPGRRTSPTVAAGPADLRGFLFALQNIAEIKRRASSFSIGRLRSELEATAATLEDDASESRRLLDAAEERTREAGVQIAAAAMPAGPFIEAFRTVLDRRTNVLSRTWRSALRSLRGALESTVAVLRRRPAPPGAEAENTSLMAIERDELRKAWPLLWEGLAADLGPDGRLRVPGATSPPVGDALDVDLAPTRRAPALATALETLAAEPVDLASFRGACEELVDRAVEDRGFALDIQAIADLATLAPIAIAAAVIVKTGGLGVDLALAGGGAASSFLMEKYSHLLGSGITAEARRRWTTLRGDRLRVLLIEAALPRAGAALRASSEGDQTLAGEIQAIARELP